MLRIVGLNVNMEYHFNGKIVLFDAGQTDIFMENTRKFNINFIFNSYI